MRHGHVFLLCLVQVELEKEQKKLPVLFFYMFRGLIPKNEWNFAF